MHIDAFLRHRLRIYREPLNLMSKRFVLAFAFLIFFDRLIFKLEGSKSIQFLLFMPQSYSKNVRYLAQPVLELS